jgi:eukaryotic-like serine/threonine-protein kinase
MDTPTEQLAAALAGRYALQDELGVGGMATVYLARDLRHERDVALKVLRPDVRDALGRERFLLEIRLAARLTHPHILPVHDSGDDAGLLWFTMPLMRGDSLRDRLSRTGPLPVDEAIRLVGEVADALDYAHRHDVVHRDIKPENILLHEGHAVVADFGIGKALTAASEQQTMATQAGVTMVGVTVGTPAYMSPEQAAGEAVDGRSDLFALGCVLYEMLTGEVAFSAPTVQATIARRFVHTPPPVSSVRPDVSVALSQLVDQLLAKSAGERPGSGAELLTALRTPMVVASAASAPTAHTERSVVVLPFENVSADPENEFFSDGLTDEVITDLSRVKALRVIARSSSMPYKRSTASLREIGDALGVRHALTGAVRRAGTALRITAQLVDVRTNEPRWADKYSGTVDDVFDVQERVSRAIVEALDVVLTPVESARLAERPLKDARAFEAYLKAREALVAFDGAAAASFIAKALEIEGPVPAIRALQALGGIMQLRSGASRAPALMDSIEREARALIDEVPDRAYGHLLLGFLGYERGDLVTAVRSLRRAMALDPADRDARFYHAIAWQSAGHPDPRAGLEWIAVDPLSPLANILVASNTWHTGRPGEGTAAMEEAVRLAPGGFIFHWALGYHYVLLGRFDAAARQATWLAEHAAQLPYTAQLRATLAAVDGRRAEALAILATVDETALDGHHTMHVAEAYAVAGEPERAVQLLDRAITLGFIPSQPYVRVCPSFEPLRGRADFAAVLARAAARAAAFPAAVADA